MKKAILLYLTLTFALVPFKAESEPITRDIEYPKISCYHVQEQVLDYIWGQATAPVESLSEAERPAEELDEEHYYIPWCNLKISLEDFKLLCITTWCESGNQDFDTQVLVAKTILNRLADERFPDTISEVIYAPKQYSVTQWDGFPDKYAESVTDQVECAVFSAIITDSTPYDLFYFRNTYYHNGRTPYTNNGVLYFSRQGD